MTDRSKMLRQTSEEIKLIRARFPLQDLNSAMVTVPCRALQPSCAQGASSDVLILLSETSDRLKSSDRDKLA